MEGRMLPIGDARYVSVLDRVVADITELRLEVLLVTNQMFPKATFSDTAFAVANSRFGASFSRRNRPIETNFNRTNAARKIGVTGRQSEHYVHMFGQHHPSIDAKRPLLFRLAHRFAQSIDIYHQQAISASLK